MSIVLGSNFDVQTALPLDSRTVVTDSGARDAINSLRRYEGMIVYVEADETNYQLVGGITNSDWKELSSGGSGGGSGGGSLLFIASPGSEAFLTSLGGVPAFEFPTGSDGELKFSGAINIPDDFVVGTPISLQLKAQGFNNSQYFGIGMTVSRIRPGSQVITSTASMEDWATEQATGNVRSFSISVTDGSGQINGTDVEPGDIIKVFISRIAPTSAPAATGSVFLFHGLIKVLVGV